jgi:hypothetical protein
MRSEIRTTDGRAHLTVSGGKIVLRVETSYREEASITLDPHVAALLAGEVERAAWKAQRAPVERRKCPECPGGDLCFGPACLVEQRPAAPAEHLGMDV